MSRIKRKSPATVRGGAARGPAGRAARGGRADPVECALAALAHEIRTPLNGILALAELLITSDLPERERGWASAIKQGAQHLDALTTLVVDSARSRVRGLALRTEPFNPRALAESLAVSLRERATVKGLAARVTIAEDLPAQMTGDAVRLRAVAENLLDNAVKFTERGHVGFSFGVEEGGRRGPRLVIAVTDEGVGLSATELRRLFRPFSQANADIARRFGGTGLGLAFAAAVAKAMGGTLEVESTPDRGSTFRLAAPLGRPAKATPDAAHAGPAAQGRPLRILCAEDNPYGRAVLHAMLSEIGHTVDFVGTGEAAVEAAGRGGYDVVVMDVTLAGQNGVEATRALRALPGAAAHVPVIGLSGHASADDEATARAAGMNVYLVKPVGPRALIEAIGQVVRD